MRPAYLRKASSHRETMATYYRTQSRFYDATRWIFLYGRHRLVEQLDIQSGERVLEIGCGTGANFDAIQSRLGNGGELIGIDCSAPMLRKAKERVERNGWANVRLLDLEYGKETITRGRSDVILFSYSLSMIADWQMALACAHSELWTGGRIGVLDFCRRSNSPKWFTEWLAINHVQADRPCEETLKRLFSERTHLRCDGWAGLWSFYLFIGMR